MKKEIPWSSIVGFLLLLALGIGIPFWMEYKSLTNPVPQTVPLSRSETQSVIDARRGYYCANCGKNTRLPEWAGGPESAGERASPLTLKTLDPPAWDALKISTRTRSLDAALRKDP